MGSIYVADKLPDGVSMSPYHQEKAKGYLIINHFSGGYYVPKTEEINKIIAKVGLNDTIEALRDVLGAMFIQLRDSLGNDIKGELSSQIGNGFEKLFAQKINEAVDSKFQLLLEKKK